jgi:hypothetical protein
MKRIAALALALAAACGSKQPTPAPALHAEPGPAGEHDMHDMHEMMANMPPEMKTFHDVLAPRWHATKGAQRMQDTCTALPDFHADADALAKATPPRGANADTWTASTRQLVTAVAELDTTCKANDATSFEVAFQKVHESFHGLMGAAGMMQDEHHEGEHPDHHDM